MNTLLKAFFVKIKVETETTCYLFFHNLPADVIFDCSCFCVFSATKAAERQTETVSEENRPAAREGETFGQTAAERWQERVSL